MNELIDKYLDKHACHLKRAREYFENLSTNEVVLKAALSVNEDSKIFPHQYRVGKTKTELAANILLQFETEILSAQSFEDIFKYTEEVRKMRIGVGHLWSYDTALRISFQKKVYPKNVYLQAGVIKGYKKIFNQNSKNRFEEKNKFPKELQILEQFEIENFLCIWGNNKQKNKSC